MSGLDEPRARIDHGWVAGAVAHFDLLLEVAEFHGRLSVEDAADAWSAMGELRAISRDLDGDPARACRAIDTWSHRLHALAYGTAAR